MIVILDFGSQLTHLISRRLRELGVGSTIRQPDDPGPADGVQGYILSGGPESVYEEKIPFATDIFETGVPILGLCYGHQLIAQHLGGRVRPGKTKEYGATTLKVVDTSGLFAGLGGEETVWMSHGDTVEELPSGFRTIGSSATCKNAAMADDARRIYGLQFHPEVEHTQHGMVILKNFIQATGIESVQDTKGLAQSLIEGVRRDVGEGKLIMGVSGGVDSLVCSVLIREAIGDRVHCVYVNTGLMRKDEGAYVAKLYQELGFPNFIAVDASSTFLSRLAGVDDPEEKRKIIGHAFIEVFEKTVEEIAGSAGIEFLGQGTIFPDRIESAQPSQSAAKIKSHHNLTLPEKMRLRVVEPLKELYKDEVRALGRELGIPDEALLRHPFPGPGLAIRVLGAVDEEKLCMVREADAIFVEELHAAGEYANVWQALAALLPVRTVGVMGDGRTYEFMITLRAVTSSDAMTADWARLPTELLERVSGRIINEVKGVNRVVYDITQKPPGTIEYE